ncbi:MAG: hypothetical protein K2P09_03745 [Erysipelotrichales bacterium]|nr:hypothetical protein [Erysipelotrichales bacterium]
MNTVIAKLLPYIYNTYHRDIYYDISYYILTHIYDIKNMTVSEFAQNCHTSLSTVKKFCQGLGYKDFNVFKQYLISTIHVRENQIAERYQDFSIDDILKRIDILGETEIDKDKFMVQIRKVVDDIYQSQRTYIIGATFPLALSLNFIEDMIIFGKPFLIQNVDNDLDEALKRKDSYSIVVSVTGRYFMLNLVRFQLLQELEVKTCVISQNNSIQDKLHNISSFIHLPGNNDTENMNSILLEIFQLIKFVYYQTYVINK